MLLPLLASLILHNVTLPDGSVHDIVIEGERIEAITDSHAHGEATVIDATGKFVHPGFVDMHAHVFLHPWDEKGQISPRYDRQSMLKTLRLLLEHGVTTIRDPGSETEAAVTLRRMIENGTFLHSLRDPRLGRIVAVRGTSRVLHGVLPGVMNVRVRPVPVRHPLPDVAPSGQPAPCCPLPPRVSRAHAAPALPSGARGTARARPE